MGCVLFFYWLRMCRTIRKSAKVCYHSLAVGRYIYTYRVTEPGMHPAGRGPAAALPIGMYIHR
ncbi:MAG: hypothetical protein E6R02_06100 [Gammaproteobacteria bacterium]|nr:MAG: hypothetical protein E6R02_06100 [Gammaproteobacteria bacterium]